MHTNPIDDNGTDLPELVKMNVKNCDVKFSDGKLSTEALNMFYNSCDVVLNVASNEGFGLGSCEALRAGTPIIVNVTGGLQDQCGFKLNGEFLTGDDYVEIGSLHDKDNPIIDEMTWGEWVEPIWPSNRSLQGSPVTPYIFDDRCSYEDAAKALKQWYDTPAERRTECGLEGSVWVNSVESGMSARYMGQRFIDSMDGTFDNWQPKNEVVLWKI